jgi:hypothetical protein
MDSLKYVLSNSQLHKESLCPLNIHCKSERFQMGFQRGSNKRGSDTNIFLYAIKLNKTLLTTLCVDSIVIFGLKYFLSSNSALSQTMWKKGSKLLMRVPKRDVPFLSNQSTLQNKIRPLVSKVHFLIVLVTIKAIT